ncbi:MAG TPA: tetratricopeptide repeat protein [Blastocatellia bacterium]|nr:tetratricopeptide repeat protein [Blastocatellia bacterium]
MAKQSEQSTRRRFAQLVSGDDGGIPLAEAALLIAAEEYPGLDIRLYLDKLRRFGAMAPMRAEGTSTISDRIAALNSLLFEELGFHGNAEHYSDPRNSFLNEVIDRRTGIPITLTLIYMEVGWQIGLPVVGVGLPFHFIAKVAGEGEDIFIDPFNGGRLLGQAGCADLVARMSGGRMELQPQHLAAVTKKQMLTRMLSNLLNIYAGSGDYTRAVGAIERILLITPDSAAHVRDLGLLLAHLGQSGRALAELERYLQLAPNAPDGETIQTQIKTLKQNRARLN